MNVLYCGKYTRRFKDIFAALDGDDRSVLELCFGDIYLAEMCTKTQRSWAGFDVNASFVSFAVSKGYDARAADLFSIGSLPQADVCVISGSLYHFHSGIDALMDLMFASANKIIISEPILNITSMPGVFGAFAARLSNVGKGNEDFRYTRNTFFNMLDLQRKRLNFTYAVISERKDLVVRITHD